MWDDARSARALPWRPVLATVGIALLVGLSSPGVPVWTELRDGDSNRAQALDGMADLVLLGLAVSTAITFVARSVGASRKAGAPPLRQTLLRAIPLTAGALALLVLLVLARGGGAAGRGGGAMEMDWFPGLGLASEQQVSPDAFGKGIPDGPGQAPLPSRGGVPPFLLVLFLAAVATAAVVALRAWRRRSRLHLELTERVDIAAAEPDRTAVRARLLSTIEEMLANPDPRTAIVGAYARLLESMAGGEGERRSCEAPREHLRRILGRLRLRADPLRTLVALFEIARFSPHRITETQRQEALAALRGALAALDDADPPRLAAGRGTPERRTA